MEPGGSMSHSQVFQLIHIPNRIHPLLVLTPISLRSILILSSNLRLDLRRGLFPVGLPVKILKALLAVFILATCPALVLLFEIS